MSEELTVTQDSFEKKNEEIKKELSFEPDKKKNFAFSIFVVLFLIFGSISVLAYYLFISTSNLSLVTEVEKITKVEDSTLNFEKFSLIKDSEYEIFLSEPRRELKLLGKGVLINERIVAFPKERLEGILPQNPLENRFQNLVIAKKEKIFQINSFQIFDSMVFLVVSDFLPGKVEFLSDEVKLGQRVFIHEYREEEISGSVENLNFLNPLHVVALSSERKEVFTNSTLDEIPSIVYSTDGKALGISVRKDSKSNLVFVPGEIINKHLENSLLNLESNLQINQNISKLGAQFEFLGLDEFKKQGLPVGPVVKEVASGGLAELGGIKQKDIILSINNQVFTSQEEMDKFLIDLKDREELKFEIVREGRKIGITLTLE